MSIVALPPLRPSFPPPVAFLQASNRDVHQTYMEQSVCQSSKFKTAWQTEGRVTPSELACCGMREDYQQLLHHEQPQRCTAQEAEAAQLCGGFQEPLLRGLAIRAEQRQGHNLRRTGVRYCITELRQQQQDCSG